MTDQEKIELLKIDTKKFNDDYYHDCYSSRGGFYLPEEVLQELSTSDVTVISAWMTERYDMMWGYGRLTKPVNTDYEGIQVTIPHIHFCFVPYAAPGICNYVSGVSLSYPSDIKKYRESKSEEESDFYMEAQVVLNNRPWTYDAFKDYIPTKSLSGDDLASRLFRKNLQKVSREHKWAERAKKLKAKEERLKKQSETEQQTPPITM